MCFKPKPPKPDPRIAEEQARQEKLASEAKAEAAEKAKREQAEQLEREKAEQEKVRAEEAATRQKAAASSFDEPKSAAEAKEQRVSKMGAANTTGRASRRSGSRSRRSLITGLGGGIGYFDRFAK